MTKKRHSEAVLSDLRDQWWGQDYLELVAKRLQLPHRQSVLDVGCGQGHWGQRLLPLMQDGAVLEGIDQERDWVSRAQERSRSLGLAERCHYCQGDATELPYEDESFDLVTCQTLLMHLADPMAALREMLRTLKPGGTLLLAEPSNTSNQFSTDTVNRTLSPADISEIANLLLSCSRGRASLGRGDDSIGDVLPVMLSRLGLQDIRSFQNDRTSDVLPPYSEVIRAQLDEETGHAKSGFWLWNKDDARSLYEAGGGEMTRFERGYSCFLRKSTIFEEQVQAETYARTGGGHHYLIVAEKR